jgi:tetratricopeptide (TPR) repeat protein
LQVAETLRTLEAWEEAREAYVRVLDSGLQSTDLLLRLGQVEERLNRPAQAEEAYRGALRLNPDEPLGHYHLGRLHRDRGDREKATRAWRRYLVLAGDSEQADAIRADLNEGGESEGEAS